MFCVATVFLFEEMKLCVCLHAMAVEFDIRADTERQVLVSGRGVERHLPGSQGAGRQVARPEPVESVPRIGRAASRLAERRICACAISFHLASNQVGFTIPIDTYGSCYA